MGVDVPLFLLEDTLLVLFKVASDSSSHLWAEFCGHNTLFGGINHEADTNGGPDRPGGTDERM